MTWSLVLLGFLLMAGGRLLAQNVICDTLEVTPDGTGEVQLDRRCARVVLPSLLTNEFLDVRVTRSGFYRFMTDVEETADQLNETFFLTIQNPEGSNANLCDPNSGPLKIIRDAKIIRDIIAGTDTLTRNAGTYFLRQGLNRLTLNHIVSLADSVDISPFITEPIGPRESVHLVRVRVSFVAETDFDLALRKTINGQKSAEVEIGEPFSYAVAVTNNGPGTVHDVVLSDTLPPAIVVDPASYSPRPPDSSRTTASQSTILFWSFDSLAQQEQTTITFVARAGESAAIGDTLLNLVEVTKVCDTDTTNNVDFTRAIVIQRPDVSISKSSVPDTVDAGETIMYTLTLAVEGTEATDVTVVDFLPPLIRVDTTSLQPPAAFAGDSIRWDLGALPPGQRTLRFDAALVPDPPVGINPIINRVVVRAGNEAPSRLGNNAAADTALNINAVDISVSKRSSADSLVPGESVIYTLVVSNPDIATARNVTATDLLPPEIVVDRTTVQPPGAIFTPDSIRWVLGALPANSDTTLTFAAELTSTVPPGIHPVVNTVVVRAENEEATRLENNTATDTLFSVNIIDVAVSKTSSVDLASPGDRYLYTIAVANQEDLLTEEVVLTDHLPSGIIPDPNSLRPPTAILQGDSIRWEVGDLQPQATDTLRFEVEVVQQPGTSQIVNTAVVSAANEDPARLQNNFAADTVFVLIPPRSDISVTKSATVDTTVPGGVFAYRIVVANRDTVTATNVRVTDFLPAALQPVPSSVVPSAEKVSPDSIRWQLDDLAAAAADTLTFQVTVSEGVHTRRLVNRVEVAAENEDAGKLADNQAADTTFVKLPVFSDISVTKTASTEVVRQGETFSFAIVVANDDTVTATEVVATDFLPANLVPDQSSFQPANALVARDSIRWELGDLPPGTQQPITFDVRVAAQAPPGPLTNRVVVRATNEDRSKLDDNEATATVSVPAQEGCDLFTLDVNVFEPARNPVLGINFELARSREIRVDLRDISGYLVRKLFEGTFPAGLNRREWDGRMENGEPVGSGIYVVTFKSGDGSLVCWKNVIIRR